MTCGRHAARKLRRHTSGQCRSSGWPATGWTWPTRSLHAMVDEGADWPEAASELADRNPSHARRAVLRGHRESARSRYLMASACFRFGQALLADDDARKRALYARMLHAFRRGGELSD